MILGKLISAYRKQQGMSLRQFSRQTGIDYTTLWRLENGDGETCKQWPAILRWVFGK